ncbi:hypothetical protein F9K85_02955 [Brucella tritici]|uniref:Uncharacterized protein n=1 Tax=Brucella tritici TaxID=94626 RepID=A0A6L3YT81_9HYPH|nr:hypothetical protein F9K94_01405 [Brucella tritici]KAB2665221.1 hypothetical protein F9K91_10855 [Brucella tritici]KAB2678518.1 hypothetical protein F9K85_02955 [Brucella tritici]KAB2687426.1 hypothetical protein F9L08_07650 [Brucella tritici]
MGFSFRIGKKYRDRRIVTTNQEGLPECFKNQAKIKHIRRFLTGLYTGWKPAWKSFHGSGFPHPQP